MPESNTPLAMLSQSLPHGLTARAFDLERDPEPIAEIQNHIAKETGYPLLSSAEDLREELTGEGIDLRRDLVVITSDVGEVAAWGQAWRSGSSDPRAFLFGGVRPSQQRRGIGRAVLHWSRRRAEELLTDAPTAGIYLQLPESDIAAQRLIAAAGGTAIRYYSDMLLRFSERHTSNDLATVKTLEGYRALPINVVDAESVRQLRNHCFADHWGSWEFTAQTWSEIYAESSFRPNYSEVVVTEEGQPVALQLTSEFPQDVATIGRVLWLGHLGVHREHRNRGLASLLLERHLVAAHRDGYEGSMLGVDAASLTGAHLLYERVGYRRRTGSIRYQFPRLTA
jgi:mycothiol synthase